MATTGASRCLAPLKLNTGADLPRIGFGCWDQSAASGIPTDAAKDVVVEAIRRGYRHIDTAAMYGNEKEVGEAVRASGVPRAELFVTTKIKGDDFADAKTAAESALASMDIEYIDLLLLHWPGDGYVEAYKALEPLLAAGSVKALGVSNFGVAHLEALLAETSVVPAVNQIEIHPFVSRERLLAFHASKGIVTTAFCPLVRCKKFDDPTLVAVAEETGVTPAEVLLRWSVQRGFSPLPKSSNPERMSMNLALEFELTEEQMTKLNELGAQMFLASVTAGKFGQLDGELERK